MEKRTTIRDIAAKAGMHFTTVALALRNSPRINPETRERIQKLAEELGYRPDPMLAALNVYRHSQAAPQYQATIAWVNNWPERDLLYSIPEFKQYYEGAIDRARERGYIVEEFWLHEPGMQSERLHSILHARNVRALILAPQPSTQPNPMFRYDEFSEIALGYSIRPSIYHLVTNHHFHTITLILGKLKELGYKRVGLCVDPLWEDKVENAWLSGLMLWQSQNPEMARLPIYTGKTSVICSETLQELKDWIDEHQPDVLVSHNKALQLLRELKYKIPEEIGFASLVAQRGDTQISGAYQNDYLVGQKAVDLLIDMLLRDEKGAPKVAIRTLVESEWIPGSTLRGGR